MHFLDGLVYRLVGRVAARPAHAGQVRRPAVVHALGVGDDDLPAASERLREQAAQRHRLSATRRADTEKVRVCGAGVQPGPALLLGVGVAPPADAQRQAVRCLCGVQLYALGQRQHRLRAGQRQLLLLGIEVGVPARRAQRIDQRRRVGRREPRRRERRRCGVEHVVRAGQPLTGLDRHVLRLADAAGVRHRGAQAGDRDRPPAGRLPAPHHQAAPVYPIASRL